MSNKNIKNMSINFIFWQKYTIRLSIIAYNIFCFNFVYDDIEEKAK